MKKDHFHNFCFPFKMAKFKDKHTFATIVKIGLKNTLFNSLKFVLDALMKTWSHE